MLRYVYVDNSLTCYDVVGTRTVRGSSQVVLTNGGNWYAIEAVKKKGIYYVPPRGVVNRLLARPTYTKIEYQIRVQEVVNNVT